MYSRKVDGETLEFGHEGVLYRNSFIMYDTKTRSLWVHTTGEAVKGAMKGKQLQFIPVTITPWKKWKRANPETTVLTGRRARGMMGSFEAKRHVRLYGLSLGQGRKAKLYPYTVLEKRRVINDTFDGRPVVIVYDPDSATAVTFDRTVGEETLEFEHDEALLMKDGSGARWNMMRGRSEEGEKRLRQRPATPWLIERWKGFYGDKEIFQGK